ncbi:MAG: UbiD family decarboxylase [Chloroflexi bacterium]|nr:UbiD family decarboxylase [Chloroflexota bacterium]
MLKDLRSFLQVLEERGDLAHITEPVDPRFGVAAGMQRTSSIQGPALWFDHVVGSSMPVVGALYAARRRALWGLETTPSELFDRFVSGLKHPLPPRLVSDGPCKEVILAGDDADFGQLPVCTHNRKDAGAFITMGLQIARHPAYGSNVSIHRMQIFDARTAGMLCVQPQHLGVYYAEAEARGEPLEVAVALGCDPYTTFCSQVQGSIYLDEFAVAGGWMGEPVELVRCETIDVAVPATSEIVLEGELLPGERRWEGPFGEYPGYYSPAGPRPVFKLKAITHRRNPIYLAGMAGMPPTDNHGMKDIPFEAMLYDRLRQICPTIRDVCSTIGGVCKHVVISMRPTYLSQARDVLLAALTTERIRPKLVIVVDEDVDARDPVQVEWALATRFQADRDTVVFPRAVAQWLDPSTPLPDIGTVMGIDATRPYGQPFWEKVDVPGADSFVIPGWTDQ